MSKEVVYCPEEVVSQQRHAIDIRILRSSKERVLTSLLLSDACVTKARLGREDFNPAVDSQVFNHISRVGIRFFVVHLDDVVGREDSFVLSYRLLYHSLVSPTHPWVGRVVLHSVVGIGDTLSPLGIYLPRPFESRPRSAESCFEISIRNCRNFLEGLIEESVPPLGLLAEVLIFGDASELGVFCNGVADERTNELPILSCRAPFF